MRSRGWASPPPPQHSTSLWNDAYEGIGPDPAHDPGLGRQTSLTSPFTSACGGVSRMTCPRCDGLLVSEYLLNPREGSLSGFHGSRCLNCGAIHDDVIRLNRRLPPSQKRVRSPVAGLILASGRAKSLARSQHSNGRRGSSHVEKAHSGRR
jgi:hypothetical protein